MILGVHVPEEAKDEEEIRTLCGNYRRRGNLFQWLNLAAGMRGLFSLLCQYHDVSADLVPLVREYLCGTYYFIIHYHREMYRIKQKKGWIRHNSPPLRR